MKLIGKKSNFESFSDMGGKKRPKIKYHTFFACKFSSPTGKKGIKKIQKKMCVCVCIEEILQSLKN